MAMEGVLKCLIRDAQALGRGYAHIKTSSQDALGNLAKKLTKLVHIKPISLLYFDGYLTIITIF